MSAIIRAPRRGGWTALPDAALRDARLSYRARGVLAYMLSHVEGWRCTAEDIARAGREGRDAIRAALRELREAGYLEVRRTQDARGRWRTETWVHDTPAGAPTPEKPTAGKPASGRPDVGDPGPNKQYQHKYQKEAAAPRAHARVRARACEGGEDPAPPAAAAMQQKRRRIRRSGLITWTDDDIAEAQRLESETPTDELAEAVAAVRSAGQEPVPGRVALALERQRQRRQAEASAAERRAAVEAASRAALANRDLLEQGLSYMPPSLRAFAKQKILKKETENATGSTA